MSDESKTPAAAPSTKTPEPAAQPAAKKAADKTTANTAPKTTKTKATPAAKSDPAPKMVLRITAKPKTGFRRCGIHHPAEPVEYPAGTFDPAQIAVLKADPSLVVEEPEAQSAS